MTCCASITLLRHAILWQGHASLPDPKSWIDESKLRTPEELAAALGELATLAANRKTKLAPQITELRTLRANAQVTSGAIFMCMLCHRKLGHHPGSLSKWIAVSLSLRNMFLRHCTGLV